MRKQKFNNGSFTLLSLAHTVSGLCWIAPLLLPLIREELHLTYTQAGLLLTCYAVVFSIFSILSGHLADLYQARKILSFGFLLTTATFSLLLFTQSYFQMIAVLALIAIGVSVFYPVGMALVSRGWQKGIFFGIFEAAGCTGILIATLLFSPLVVSLGWRLTSLILALPSLPIGLAFLTSHVNLEYVDSRSRPKSSSTGLKSFVLFYLARGVQIFGGVAVMSFMPLFAVDVGGLSPEKASIFLIFVWGGAVPAVLVYGVLSDFYSPLKIILVLLLITIPTVFAVTLPLPLLAVFVLLIALGFCNIGAWVPQNMWLSRVTLEKTRGKVFGGTLSLVSLAQISSPLFFGFLADKWGLVATYRWALLPMIIAALLLGKLVREVDQIETV